MTTKLLRYPAEIIVLICLVFAVLYRPADDAWDRPIESDGKGYYAYLPAVFIYNDLHFGFVDEYESTYYPHGFSYVNFLNETEDGGKVNQFFCGVAVLWLPFFLLAHALSLLFGFEPDGYSLLYQQSIMAASLFYLWLGCRFAHKIIQRLVSSPGAAAFILFAVVFATPIAFYSLYFPSFTHVYSFALVAVFIHLCYMIFEERKRKHFLLAVFTLALICIIRPVNAIIILMLPFAAGSWSNLRDTALFYFKQVRTIAFSALIAIAVFLIPVLFWKGQTGHFFVYSYGVHKFNFTDPALFDNLFSYRKGLFVYTPLAFIALLGLVPLASKHRFRFAWITIFVLLLAYLLSAWSWWWYGTTFGQRSYFDHFAVLAILLCILLTSLRSKGARVAFYSIITLLGALNIFQCYQYAHGILPGDHITKDIYWSLFLDVRKEAKVGIDKAEYTLVADLTAAMEDSPSSHSSLTTENAFSGKQSSRIDAKVPFSVNAEKEITITESDTNMIVKASVMVFAVDEGKGSSFVLSIQSGSEVIAYQAIELEEYTDRNDWVRLEQVVKVPAGKNGKAVIKAYCWNHDGGSPLLVDDLRLELYQRK